MPARPGGRRIKQASYSARCKTIRIAQWISWWWRVEEVIGFVLALCIIVNADVVCCFVLFFFVFFIIFFLYKVVSVFYNPSLPHSRTQTQDRDEARWNFAEWMVRTPVNKKSKSKVPVLRLFPHQRSRSKRCPWELKGKVVISSLTLVLNIKASWMNFSAPFLIFDVMRFRGACPPRIPILKMEHVTAVLLASSPSVEQPSHYY